MHSVEKCVFLSPIIEKIPSQCEDDDNWLQRHVETSEEEKIDYIYVLETNLKLNKLIFSVQLKLIQPDSVCYNKI